MLSGEVPTRAGRDLAVSKAKNVKGVKGVKGVAAEALKVSQ